MTYNVSITFKDETFSTDYENIEDVYQVVNILGSYYGNDTLVAVSDNPFTAIKFKDIEKLAITGISRSDLRKYGQEKMAKEQAEKMAEYRAQAMQDNAIGTGLAANLCQSSGSRLI